MANYIVTQSSVGFGAVLYTFSSFHVQAEILLEAFAFPVRT